MMIDDDYIDDERANLRGAGTPEVLFFSSPDTADAKIGDFFVTLMISVS